MLYSQFVAVYNLNLETYIRSQDPFVKVLKIQNH